MFETITGFIERAGYVGIAALMFLENLFPPIPSELVMPAAGYQAANGRLALPGVVVAGVLGSLAGALFWYWIGRRVGDDRLKAWAGRHGRWLAMTPSEIDRADRWFDRHCGKAVLLGRLVPAVRTLISVPAGIFGMGIRRFLMFSALGSAIWTTALALAGHGLGQNYKSVSGWLDPVTNGIVAAIVLFYIYRVVTWKPDPQPTPVRPGRG